MKNNKNFKLDQYQLKEMTDKQLVEINGGGLLAYLFGWTFALGCKIGEIQERMREADRQCGQPLAYKN